MKVVKKINNNVAEYEDESGNELIAFGKGIGFPKTPYELTDLSKITMTFYKLNEHFEILLKELSEEIIDLSVGIVSMAQKELAGNLNPTIVFSLADHIQFSLQRLSQYKDARLVYSHEVEQLYPKENQVAEKAVVMIQNCMQVTLPKNEITAITMHFVDSQAEYKVSQEEIAIEEVISEITSLIEKELSIDIDQDEFNYERFRMHMFYYLKRVRSGEKFVGDNTKLLTALQKEHKNIYFLAVKVSQLIEKNLGNQVSNDELLYLMIHLNRLYEKSNQRKFE
ncbi:PRD domain-containing protein [Tetragenococcus solitarius]|uniref:PRD domain-containing protein n=1 Tax=Tetragenococcus solitarius TaxID=71453 RepID=A0ABP6KTK6_9ENTE|nr:PRD domain-containing protein [Tetragenococcus solitarius]